MELALALGFRTVESLRREMTERELGRWYDYARRHGGLPLRRIELMLANLGRISASSGAGIADFIIDPILAEEISPPPAVGAKTEDEISAMFGGAKVIKLGQRKRKRDG